MIILLYHSVEKVEKNPWGTFVSPKHFEEHLEILRKYFYPLSIKQLLDCINSDNIPDNAITVTFDDGYANNLYIAKPMLEKYEIPATIFITTKYLNQDKEFWWDELENIILRPGQLPRTLTITINGNQHKFELDGHSYLSESEYLENINWRFSRRFPTKRHELLLSLWDLFLNISYQEQNNIISYLYDWSGLKRETRKTHKILSWEGLQELSSSPLIEIGCHTDTHPVLSNVDESNYPGEISSSKNVLEDKLQKPVIGFSYPFGKDFHYNEHTVSYVKNSGFDYACSNFKGLITKSSDLHQLPRFVVMNLNGKDFIKIVHEWNNKELSELRIKNREIKESKDKWKLKAQERLKTIREQILLIKKHQEPKHSKTSKIEKIKHVISNLSQKRTLSSTKENNSPFSSPRLLSPLSSKWGFDRGNPIDRYYIEKFLSINQNLIKGRVLEIKDNEYTLLYGNEKVDRSDILDIEASNKKATMIADLSEAQNIVSDIYDCIIITQTLQLIYDIEKAVSNIYRILKPGGVVLATFPGITKIDTNLNWYWGLTTQSTKILFEKFFHPSNIEISKYGNVLSASAFLYGLSTKELNDKELDYLDPEIEMLISVRAFK